MEHVDFLWKGNCKEGKEEQLEKGFVWPKTCTDSKIRLKKYHIHKEQRLTLKVMLYLDIVRHSIRGESVPVPRYLWWTWEEYDL